MPPICSKPASRFPPFNVIWDTPAWKPPPSISISPPKASSRPSPTSTASWRSPHANPSRVVRTHQADYQAQHSLSFLERNTLEALLACRSGSLRSTLYQCSDCGQKHFVHRSCGNRHCPQCQQHKARQWSRNQQSRQLPVPYFLLTFTVAQPLRRFLRSHKRPGYEALFQASSQALKKLARDPRLLGSDLAGFTGILHTWGCQLQYHPHIHYLVPAGAVSPDRKHWLS